VPVVPALNLRVQRQAQHNKRGISISHNGEHSEGMGRLSDGANGHVTALYYAN
jgi:hypothetical protein